MAAETTDDLVQGSITPSRAVNTTVPLTGGGALSTDRTIAISDVVGDSGAGGVKGAVPAPGAGDAAAKKYLGADGLWSHVIAEVLGTHGESITIKQVSEEITLDTGAAFTDSTANLLPAYSIILGVVARLTEAVTTSSSWQLGDPTTAGRFTAPNSTLLINTRDIGLLHMQGGISTDATGPVQMTSAKLRVTLAGGNPGAGKVRATVFYAELGLPTS